jgi:hypothetical protein
VEVDERGWPEVRVVDLVGDQPVVQVPGEGRVQLTDDDYAYIVSSPHTDAMWESHQRSGEPDGVAWGDGLVSDALRGRLQALFDTLCAGPVDHHPGSGSAVRDLVHPSLYPFIRGITPLARSGSGTSRATTCGRSRCVSTDGGRGATSTVSVQGALKI